MLVVDYQVAWRTPQIRAHPLPSSQMPPMVSSKILLHFSLLYDLLSNKTTYNIKFLNTLKLLIAKLAHWDNLESNLPSQNRVCVEDQTLSEVSTPNAKNIASPVYHTTQNTNLCVFRFSILRRVHLFKYVFQTLLDDHPLMLYELIFVNREDYIRKIFQIYHIDRSNAFFERHHRMF